MEDPDIRVVRDPFEAFVQVGSVVTVTGVAVEDPSPNDEDHVVPGTAQPLRVPGAGSYCGTRTSNCTDWVGGRDDAREWRAWRPGSAASAPHGQCRRGSSTTSAPLSLPQNRGDMRYEE